MMSPIDLVLREQAGDDAAIVRRAHAAHARWSGLAEASWPPATVAAMRDQQHLAHERHLAAYHPGAEKLMILVGGVAVGRLVVDRDAGPWHVVDLALIAEAQGAGIGTAVMRSLLGDAARADAAVVLEVGVDNPRADAFYRRLGFFEAAGGSDLQWRLRWDPVKRLEQETETGN